MELRGMGVDGTGSGSRPVLGDMALLPDSSFLRLASENLLNSQFQIGNP
jgi:hypothetical protein